MLEKSDISVSNDVAHIHPKSFCGFCQTKAKRYFDAKQLESSLDDYQWTEHLESGYTVCAMQFVQESKGGTT